MAMRYRKSSKIGGVRVSVNKKSVSVSTGVKGLRYTASTSGRRTTTVSAPGTGVYYTRSHTGSAQQQAKSRPSAPPAPVAARPAVPRKPGLFAPTAEKLLYAGVVNAREHMAADIWMPKFDQARRTPGSASPRTSWPG